MLTQPKFAVVTEHRNGYTSDTVFDTLEAALAHANYEWSQMSDRERRWCTRYVIMTGYLDELNCFNTQLAEIVRTYR
jgi:hypothetical protein